MPNRSRVASHSHFSLALPEVVLSILISIKACQFSSGDGQTLPGFEQYCWVFVRESSAVPPRSERGARGAQSARTGVSSRKFEHLLRTITPQVGGVVSQGCRRFDLPGVVKSIGEKTVSMTNTAGGSHRIYSANCLRPLRRAASMKLS